MLQYRLEEVQWRRLQFNYNNEITRYIPLFRLLFGRVYLRVYPLPT